MSRVVIYFKTDEMNSINVPATDIFEQGEYLHIYNGTNLIAIILKETIKVIYKSIKKEN